MPGKLYKHKSKKLASTDRKGHQQKSGLGTATRWPQVALLHFYSISSSWRSQVLAEKAALFARAEFFHQLALFARKVFGNLDIDHDDLSATLFAAKSRSTVPG